MKMNVRAVLLGVLAILFVSMPAAAATVDGKWAGSLETPMGTIPVSYRVQGGWRRADGHDRSA